MLATQKKIVNYFFKKLLWLLRPFVTPPYIRSTRMVCIFNFSYIKIRNIPPFGVEAHFFTISTTCWIFQNWISRNSNTESTLIRFEVVVKNLSISKYFGDLVMNQNYDLLICNFSYWYFLSRLSNDSKSPPSQWNYYAGSALKCTIT